MRQWHDWYAPCRWSQAIFGALIPMRSTHDGVSQQCNISLRARMPRAKFVAIKSSPAFSFEQLPVPGMCHYYLRSTGRWNWKFSASSPSWGIAQCEVKVSAYIQVDFEHMLHLLSSNETIKLNPQFQHCQGAWMKWRYFEKLSFRSSAQLNMMPKIGYPFWERRV